MPDSGRSVVLEHNGDVYACDHCVYPEFKLGNIGTDNLLQMVGRSAESGFGITKETALPGRAASAVSLRHVGAAVQSTVLQELSMMSRGFIISVKDTRSSFCTSGNSCRR